MFEARVAKWIPHGSNPQCCICEYEKLNIKVVQSCLKSFFTLVESKRCDLQLLFASDLYSCARRILLGHLNKEEPEVLWFQSIASLCQPSSKLTPLIVEMFCGLWLLCLSAYQSLKSPPESCRACALADFSFVFLIQCKIFINPFSNFSQSKTHLKSIIQLL